MKKSLICYQHSHCEGDYNKACNHAVKSALYNLKPAFNLKLTINVIKITVMVWKKHVVFMGLPSNLQYNFDGFCLDWHDLENAQ